MKLRVFLGSSSETRTTMEMVAQWIEELGHSPCKWTDVGVFPLGRASLSALHDQTRQVDAAVFIFGEDDVALRRQAELKVPRDNVLMEFGLFSGVLGEEAVAVATSGKPDFPSDFAGITYLPLNTEDFAKRQLAQWLERCAQHGFPKRDSRPPGRVPSPLARPTYSEESLIRRFRCKLWSYHATQRGYRTIWRVALLDFTSSCSLNNLHGTFEDAEHDGKIDSRYIVDAFVREDKLVLLIKPLGDSETTGIRVYPKGGAAYGMPVAGLSFHTNFHHEPAINPTILSTKPELELREPKMVEDESVIAQLNALWRERLGGVHVFVPTDPKKRRKPAG